MDDQLVTLLLQLVGGAIGGNLAGAALRNLSLGAVGNTLAGLIGGGVGGQVLSSLLNLNLASVAGGEPTDLLAQAGSGGAGGILALIVVGILRSVMARA